MDKETLSNYGWIVICVLVLAVMLALATPFGNFISTAVKSTTQGLFDVNKNALNSTGLINIGDQSFDSKDLNDETATFYYDHGDYIYLRNSYSGNEIGAPTIEEGRKFVKEYAAILLGASFDDILAQGITEDDLWNEFGLTEDTFEPAVLGNGWGVMVKSTDKTSYGPILESINGEPITNVTGTFYDCESLIVSPEIPSGVTDMYDTFYGCTSLTTAPTIPNSVTDMTSTFQNCTSLTTAPAIPNSVTNMYGTFKGCTSLTTAPVIPNSVTNMSCTFRNCTSLSTAHKIPNSVTNMSSTFSGCTSLASPPDMSNANNVTDMSCTFENCTSLTTAPKIPDSVTDMSLTFFGCTSLTTAPVLPPKIEALEWTFSDCVSLKTYVGSTDFDGNFSNYIIPSSVTDMGLTFGHCTSIVTAPTIPSNVTDMSSTFIGCKNLATAPVIPNGVTDMCRTFEDCISLIVAPEIPDGVTNMSSTFFGCTSLTTASTIPSSVTDMDMIFRKCTSLTGTIEINANPTNYINCFVYTSKPIILTGTSTMLSQISEGWSNITIQQ